VNIVLKKGLNREMYLVKEKEEEKKKKRKIS